MRKGFTLLELIIVIIIIGVLATLGFTQYAKMIEKGRAAEARSMLGTIRSAQEAYKLEYGNYTTTAADLGTELPAACASQSTHYFDYDISSAGQATADRCTSGGKNPAASAAYAVSLGYANGTIWSTGGY